MAKKKTTQTGQAAKPAAGRAKKKATTAAAEGKPPAAVAAQPEATAAQQQIVQVLGQHGVIISFQQLALLPDQQILDAQKWVDAVAAADGQAVPPMPRFLLSFATREVREQAGPPAKPGLPPRKFMACEFGSVSVGDGTCRIPVTVDGEVMDPNEAAELLRGRRLEVVLVRAPGSSSTKPLPGMEDADTQVKAICDVKSFKVAPKHYGFSVTLPLKEIDVSALTELAASRHSSHCTRRPNSRIGTNTAGSSST